MKSSFPFRFLLGILLAGLFLGAASGQNAANFIPQEKSLLWSISGKGIKGKSYLFGTIHFIDQEELQFPPALRPSIQECSGICFEIDMQDMQDVGKVLPVMMRSVMRNDTTLRDLLTESEYQEVGRYFQSSGLPLMLLERIKPMFLSALALDEMGPLQASEGQWTSCEAELQAIAREEGIPGSGLETMEFQVGLFDSIPYQVQARMLLQAIRQQGGEGSGELDTLTRLYREQDIAGMQALFQSDQEALFGPYLAVFLDERNRRWVEQIAERSRKERVFYAVGAGHLGGEQGVIALLRQKGYLVEPVK